MNVSGRLAVQQGQMRTHVAGVKAMCGQTLGGSYEWSVQDILPHLRIRRNQLPFAFCLV